MAQELPELLNALAARLGLIRRVIYRAVEWTLAPNLTLANGQCVLLEQSRYQSPGTIRVEGVHGGRLTLFVVPPWGDPHLAYAAMIRVAFPSDVTTVAELLEMSEAAPAGRVHLAEGTCDM